MDRQIYLEVDDVTREYIRALKDFRAVLDLRVVGFDRDGHYVGAPADSRKFDMDAAIGWLVQNRITEADSLAVRRVVDAFVEAEELGNSEELCELDYIMDHKQSCIAALNAGTYILGRGGVQRLNMRIACEVSAEGFVFLDPTSIENLYAAIENMSALDDLKYLPKFAEMLEYGWMGFAAKRHPLMADGMVAMVSEWEDRRAAYVTGGLESEMRQAYNEIAKENGLEQAAEQDGERVIEQAVM